MIKAGIIGCGRVVEQYHAPAFKTVAHKTRVLAISDPSEARLSKIGQILNIPRERRYLDYRVMLSETDIDFVDIAAPNYAREEILAECIRNRCHVLSEKPLTSSFTTAKELGAQARQGNVVLGVFHNYAFLPGIVQVSRITESGDIGTPFLYRAEFLSSRHFQGTPEYDPDWRTRRHLSGGGCLLDNTYHFLYLAEHLVRSPIDKVYAQTSSIGSVKDVENLALLVLNHSNGALSSLQSSWAVPGKGQKVHELHGSRGSLRFGYAAEFIEMYTNSDASWKKVDIESSLCPDFFVASFAGVLDDYIHSLLNQREPCFGVNHAIRVLALIQAAYESSEACGAIDCNLAM